jgi:pyrroloquinoline quinone biosynthesis protein B
LTNADLDHTLGLFILREGGKLVVHAPAKVRQSLTQGLALDSVLGSYCGLEWATPPAKAEPLRCRDGSPSGLLYQAISLPGRPPRFVGSAAVLSTGHSAGYLLTDENTKGRMLFLPQVGVLDEALISLLSECSALLFDGTFWSENEMKERGVGDVSASGMGHLPISGPGGSLKILAKLKLKDKIYFHINNTNPILFEDSPERDAVLAAGCTIGMDGMELMI